jgi:hypothetical protein
MKLQLHYHYGEQKWMVLIRLEVRQNYVMYTNKKVEAVYLTWQLYTITVF